MSNHQHEGAYASAFEKSRESLRQLSPKQIEECAICEYDSLKKCFYITSFGRDFKISFPEGKIFYRNIDISPPTWWSLILLNYLSSAKKINNSGEWVSYRVLPNGNVFFPSIETYVLKVLSKLFSESDKNILQQRLLQLGFKPKQTKADVAAEGYFTPRVPVLIQFWEGEEDIPSSCQILFDRSISEHMHIEDIAALCYVIKDLLLEND